MLEEESIGISTLTSLRHNAPSEQPEKELLRVRDGFCVVTIIATAKLQKWQYIHLIQHDQFTFHLIRDRRSIQYYACMSQKKRIKKAGNV